MSRGADIRTDVYGLGCTLYELLSGRAALCPARNGRAARRRCWPTRWSRRHRSASCAPRCRLRLPPSSSGCWPSLAAIGTRPPADVARALEPFTAGHNLASFLPPNRFVPAVAGFAEPSVTDRTAEGETAPFQRTPSRWRPRWDWSHPPRFSKPFAIPAVLSFMTVLLLAHSIWNCGQRLDPDPTRNQGNVQETTAPVHETAVRAGDLVPATLSIRLYRVGEEPDDLEDLGRIGDPRDGPQGAAVAELSIVVEADFAEPLFPYLFAINPDGTRQLLFPEEGSAISLRKGFQYPAGDHYLRLEDGLVGLILLGSRRPLSADVALEMIRVDAEAWRLDAD